MWLASALTLMLWSDPEVAGLLGWVAATATFNLWTWLRVRGMDPQQTREHATSEDTGARIGWLVTMAASLLAIAGVFALIAASGLRAQAWQVALIGVAAIAGSWFTVDMVFTLRYARLYFDHPSGAIDFSGEDDPVYADFAYLGFTIGMCYQVSDTALKTKRIRHVALEHALLSYLLGAVVIAATINLVSQLASTAT